MIRVNQYAGRSSMTSFEKKSLLLVPSITKISYQKPIAKMYVMCSCFWKKKTIRVKSGNFEHQVNSDKHLQTLEIQMRQLLMSCLIRIFTVCLVNLFFYSNNQHIKQTRSLSEFTWCLKLPDFTLIKFGGVYRTKYPIVAILSKKLPHYFWLYFHIQKIMNFLLIKMFYNLGARFHGFGLSETLVTKPAKSDKQDLWKI